MSFGLQRSSSKRDWLEATDSSLELAADGDTDSKLSVLGATRQAHGLPAEVMAERSRAAC
eukprot:scaffold2893_cov254-Pinguiococcus_pyrenoidosus.AAC.35